MQSRYYSPEWGRFINADGIVGQTGELLSHNMFSYCKNNPVNMTDKDGFKPFINNQDDAMAYTRQLENDESSSSDIDDEKKAFIATVYGEAADCSHDSQCAVANVIVNRVGKREWANIMLMTIQMEHNCIIVQRLIMG